MEEAFWNTEGGEKGKRSFVRIIDATEHVIEGSPLMMIGGLVLFAVMAAFSPY